MDKLIENKVLYVQIAQLKGELSDVYKKLDYTRGELKRSENSVSLAAERIRQEYEEKLSAMSEQYRIEQERQAATSREEVSRMVEDHRKELLEKEREIQHLWKCNADLVATCGRSLSEVNSKCDSLSSTLSKTVSRNVWLRQHYFGKSTEQARLLQNRNPLTRREEKDLFMKGEEPWVVAEDTVGLETDRRERRKSKRSRLDYGKHKAYTSDPVRIKLSDYLELGEGEHLKKRNGVVEIRTKHVIRLIPAKIEEYFIEVATVRSHGAERDSMEVEDQIIPGVPFDKEMISFILTEHFSFNTTWSNIARKLSYYGVRISDSTLGNIAHRCISYLKQAMAEVWKSELYRTDYWMIDETTGLVGTSDEQSGVRRYKTQYLWGIRANKLKLSWFIYDNGSRGRDVIKPYLDRFKGYFTTDGYVVYKLYDKLEDAEQIRCACLTHIRRLFVDALHENRSLMSWFINRIKRLFEIESECRDKQIYGGAERLAVRTCRSSVLMHQIEQKFKFYIENRSFGKLGTLTQAALKYINNEWAAMKNVLKFGDAELSNNLCEQMMRHVKVNLKNSQNIGSTGSAENFCFMYSLIESCGFNGLSPIGYIGHLLDSLRKAGSEAERRNLLPCYCKL